MTREEAIHFAVCLKNNWTINFADMEDFCDMAIEALSEPSGDLISRADAMAELREWVKRANENGETPTWNDAVSLIGSLPSADAESVVRCKDCKHWHSNTEFCSIWSFHFQNVAQRTLSHDYCSRGERKGGGDE